MTRRLRSIAVAALLAGAPAAGAADTTPLTLQELEEMALACNPTVSQASAAVRAAEGRARQAGLLPNPLIGYRGSELTRDRQKWYRQTEHFFYFEQPIIIGRKLKWGRTVFEQEAAVREARADVQRQRVRNAVRTLYYDALVATRMVEAQADLARVAREAVAISHELLNVGQADQPDVLEAEIEADRAEIQAQAALHHQESVWRVLAAMVGEADMPLRPLAGDPEEGIPVLQQDALAAALVRDSPEMKAARAVAGRERAGVSLAKSGRFGDIDLQAGVGYNYDKSHGLGGWVGGLEVAFPLPLFNRAQGAEAASRAEVELADTEVRRVELELRARLASEFRGYAHARDLVDKYRSAVIPKAERAYELYLARFREMAAAYPQVLIAQRTLAQVKAEYLDALDDVWRHAILLQGFLLEGGLEEPTARGGHEAESVLGDQGKEG